MTDAWERRKDDPQAAWNKPRKPRARKDTKRWCRGKEGVDHVLEVTLERWLGMGCKWYEISVWAHGLEGKMHRTPKGWRYSCRHIWQCENCGRKFGPINPKTCPERVEEKV